MPQGTISKVLANKGFGFIEGEKGDIFFHHSALNGTTIEDLREGQRVEYEEGSSPKGPCAENVGSGRRSSGHGYTGPVRDVVEFRHC